MSREREIVIICKIGDFSGLKGADEVEQQEQLEQFCPDKQGKMRVRKTVSQKGTDYEATIKTFGDPSNTVKDVEEINNPITSAFFEAFRGVADSLKIKTRHVFHGNKSIITLQDKSVVLPPVTYEVDVFKRPDGRESEWCKIDIELDDLFKAIENTPELHGQDLNFSISVTDLPFKPQHAFVMGDCTEEQMAAVKELWATEWSQTPYGKPLVEAQASVSQLSPVNKPPLDSKGTEAENGKVESESV